jgi:uncharacterized protein HemX
MGFSAGESRKATEFTEPAQAKNTQRAKEKLLAIWLAPHLGLAGSMGVQQQANPGIYCARPRKKIIKHIFGEH